MSVESIGTIIIAILSSIIAAYATAKHSQKQFVQQNSKEDISKAIELAETYALRIMPSINYITIIYKNNDLIKKYHEKINMERKKGHLQFTFSEVKSFFTESEIEEIEKAIDTSQIKIEDLMTARIAIHQSRISDNLFCADSEVKDKLNEQFDELLSLQLRDECKTIQIDLLNRLEYFSMFFNSQIADEETVYQSLHQTFIGTITYLYFKISLLNKDIKDKYYTNIIELYNLWNDRFVEKMHMEEEHYNNVLEKTKAYK